MSLPGAPTPANSRATSLSTSLTSSSPPEMSHSDNSSTLGRVVRLHFACRARLPLGSKLRVTGSSLWTPKSAMNAAGAEGGAVVVVAEDDDEDGNGMSMMGEEGGELEGAGTVEMVTSPETYPIWVTKTPVSTVVRPRSSNLSSVNVGSEGGGGGSTGVVQHHRYRYVAVTPGAHLIPSDEPEDGGSASTTATTASSSSVIAVQQPAVAWEDPFVDGIGLDEAREQDPSHSNHSFPSNPSLTRRDSLVGSPIRTNLADLPYRTIDIDILNAAVIRRGADGETFEVADGTEEEGEREFTEDGVRIDNWNSKEDFTFRPYVVREAIHKQNRLKFQLNNQMTELSESGGSSGDSTPTSEPHAVRLVPTDSGPSSIGSHTPTTAEPSKPRIYFVCFHLPVRVYKDSESGEWSASWNESLLAKSEGSNVTRSYEAHWVGTVTANPTIASDEDREAVRAILGKMDCFPLFLEPEVKEAHYKGMCKQVLWPAFHNIDLLDVSGSGWSGATAPAADPLKGLKGGGTPAPVTESDWDQSRLSAWWDAYTGVNRAFAEALSDVIQPGDIAWIHDYHLSLLPRMMDEVEIDRYDSPVTKKVFFLHIPFPTSQIFRELECGESILEGMLHADVVGFHAFDHARHFLNACKRIMGVNYESLLGGLIGMKYARKTVLVSMHNVSVEPSRVDAVLSLPSVATEAEALVQKHAQRKIIVGVDIAQRLSGISLKLLAFQRLLTDYPVWQNKIVMVQKCLLPGSRQADEERTKRELRFLVKKIQDTFGTGVIDYEEIPGSFLPIEKRLVLWNAADVMMNTPVREGLNLLPLEFVYAKKAPVAPGVTIASEFSAVCSILNGAVRVNPFDIQMAATSIDKALTMDDQEKEGRRARDIDFVASSPSVKWAKKVLRDLKDVTTGGLTTVGSRTGSEMDDDSQLKGKKRKKKKLITTTAGYLEREHDLAFSHLDIESVSTAFNSTKRRVIIVDFNGTIVIKEPPSKYLKREILGVSGNKPPAAVIKALTVLCEDPQNTVYVVSGDSQENVAQAIGHIPNLGLAASNGARFSRPTPTADERQWQTLDLGVDWDAVKKVALPVLSKFTARTNGSFVKLTHSSIGWSYYSCDPEWGSLQASHLVLELEVALRSFDVRYVLLKGVIEIVPRMLNKGLLVKKILQGVEVEKGGVDFILCMGDDISDEKMFSSVFSFISETGQDSTEPPLIQDDDSDAVMHDADADAGSAPAAKTTTADEPMYAFTATVGKKSSLASQYVDDATVVADILVRLSGGETSSRRRRGSATGVWLESEEKGTEFFE